MQLVATRRELGWRPTPLETTIVEMTESRRDLGLIAASVQDRQSFAEENHALRVQDRTRAQWLD
jgi:hypothetical protein